MLDPSWKYVSENDFEYKSVSKIRTNDDPWGKKSKIKSPLIWEEDFCVPVCDYSAEGEMTPSLPGLRRS